MPRARRKAPAPEPRVTNADHSDLELLHNIKEAYDGDGWATTTNIAVACGFSLNGGQKGRTPATKVASRLSWMRLGGLLESTEPDPRDRYTGPGSRDTRWRLTAAGESIVKASLSRAVSNSIDRMDAGALVLLMREVTTKAWVEGDEAVAFASRRQYENTRSRRKIDFRMGRR